MRVSISYTLDFEKIPNEVIKFIQELKKRQQKLNFLYEDAAEKLEGGDTVLALQNIMLVRKELAEVDAKLQDSAGILEGYHQALANFAAQAENEAQAEYEEVVQKKGTEAGEEDPIEKG